MKIGDFIFADGRLGRVIGLNATHVTVSIKGDKITYPFKKKEKKNVVAK